MKQIKCPNCNTDDYDIISMNGVKIKQCKKCGAYYELAEPEVETNSFVPIYEKDNNGNYPGCPKCGSLNIHKMSVRDKFIKSSDLYAIISGDKYTGKSIYSEYECLDCNYKW